MNAVYQHSGCTSSIKSSSSSLDGRPLPRTSFRFVGGSSSESTKRLFRFFDADASTGSSSSSSSPISSDKGDSESEDGGVGGARRCFNRRGVRCVEGRKICDSPSDSSSSLLVLSREGVDSNGISRTSLPLSVAASSESESGVGERTRFDRTGEDWV